MTHERGEIGESRSDPRLPQRAAPHARAVQPSRSQLPAPRLSALARRALPVAASIATAAMATLATERAIARAVMGVVPSGTAAAGPSDRRRIVVTERVQIERYRIRR